MCALIHIQNMTNLKATGKFLKPSLILILECYGDSKTVWQIINNVCGKQNKELKPNFVINNEIINRRIVANKFNKYFISLVPTLNEAYKYIVCKIPLLATRYFSQCLQQGIFPDELKVGRITPIYKKDDECLLGNYRPVSTLPIFGKIFEKIIYSRIDNFLTTKEIIFDKQFGFRKSHSTSQFTCPKFFY